MGSSGGRVRAVIDHSAQTPYSDPGRFASLLAGVAADPAGVSAVARNVIVHYRASGHELPVESRDDINARWIEELIAIDQRRHPWPLTTPRPVTDRVQGCCRDHSLFCVAVLRSHGIAARNRVGFAGYFINGWHHDHVVVEAWLDDRWVRFDAEVETPSASLPTPLDMGPSLLAGTGFVTAAEAWIGHRRQLIDADAYGVGPDVPGLRGEFFLFDEVIIEVAHRFGDELLLWDAWGHIGEPERTIDERDAGWLDEIAALLVAADAGGLDAEQQLLRRYRNDDRLHPGPTVLQASPYGNQTIEVDLTRR